MTNRYTIAVIFTLAIMSCSKDNPHSLPATPPAQTPAQGGGISYPGGIGPHYAARSPEDSIDNSRFISKELANKMIGSYLNSISNSNVDDLKALTLNADSLRTYLSCGNVARIKLIFAHTPEYIANDSGVYSGMKSGALTIIIAAYDSSGNYIYYNTNQVLEHALPCPTSCPPGYAGNELLN